MKLTILIAMFFSTLAIAGGGGTPRPTDSAALMTCKSVDGNVENVIMYRTDGGMGASNTYLHVELKSPELTLYFKLADGVKDEPTLVLGNFTKKGVYVDDLKEVFSYRSSGADGDLNLQLVKLASGLVQVSGGLKITRAKNDNVNGPFFGIDGRISCPRL